MAGNRNACTTLSARDDETGAVRRVHPQESMIVTPGELRPVFLMPLIPMKRLAFVHDHALAGARFLCTRAYRKSVFTDIRMSYHCATACARKIRSQQ